MMDKNDRFAIDNKNVLRKCVDLKCSECLFGEGLCYFERMKWLLSEYKEKIILSKFEYNILEKAHNRRFEYIIRNECGGLRAYRSSLTKSILSGIHTIETRCLTI